MKKSVKFISVILTGAMLVGVFAGCSNKNQQIVENSETEVASTTTATVEQTTVAAKPMEKEITSFVAKDSNENELSLTPIFNKDGKTVVAGYIVSAKDKNKKALTVKQYPLLNTVVEAGSDKKGVKLAFDNAKKLIPLKVYADEKGKMVAIEDMADYDGDKNKTEVLKLDSKKSKDNSTKIVINYTTVTINKQGDKLFMIDGKTKTLVKLITNKNEAVKKVENKKTTTAKNTKKSQKSTTKKQTTTAKAEPIKIVLKKNSKAECKSKKVEIQNAKVVIKDAGDFEMTSETDTWHGQIEIRLPNTKKASVKIKDVNITYNRGNIIRIIDTSIKSDRTFLEREASVDDEALDNELKEVSENDHAPNVSLSFPDGTHSSFNSTANNYTGVIYNESKLTIKGNGRVSVESGKNADNCICSTKSITVKNCAVSLKTAGYNVPSVIADASGSAKGIFSYNKVIVESGMLDIKTNGDGIRATRFISEGGTTDIASAACDALDITKEITVNAGKINAVALKKSSFKVRRVNVANANKPGIFRINGGTVIGESKKASTPQSGSKQANIIATIMNKASGDKKYGTPAKISIRRGDDSVRSSSNECTTFIFSSSNLNSSKKYTMRANKINGDVTFKNNAGKASIKA